MGNEPTVKLTSAELSQVWTSYQNDTASICILKYFLQTAVDPDVQAL